MNENKGYKEPNMSEGGDRTNPWKNGERLPCLGIPALLLLGAFTVIFSLFPAITDYTVWSLALMIFGALFVVTVSHKPLHLMILLVPAAFAWLFLGSVELAMICLSVVCGNAICAYVTSLSRKPLIVFFAIPGVIITYLLTFSIPLAALSLAAVIPGIAIGYATMAGLRRVEIICVGSIVLAIIVIFAGGIFFYNTYGTFDRDTVNGAIDSFRDEIGKIYAEVINEIKATLPEGTVIYDGMAESLAAETLNVMPAVAVCLVCIVIYMAQFLTLSIYRSTKLDKLVTKTNAYFDMSFISSLVYMIAYFIFFIASLSNGGNFVGTLCENIFIILTPGFFVVGMLGPVKAMLLRRSLLIIVMVFIMIFTMPYIIPPVVAFIGAVSVITRTLAERRKKNNNQN